MQHATTNRVQQRIPAVPCEKGLSWTFPLIRRSRRSPRWASQAENAGSIPVARSRHVARPLSQLRRSNPVSASRRSERSLARKERRAPTCPSVPQMAPARPGLQPYAHRGGPAIVSLGCIAAVYLSPAGNFVTASVYCNSPRKRSQRAGGHWCSRNRSASLRVPVLKRP